MTDKVLFSSESTDWETPDWFFDKVNDEFSFNLDVCANKENTKTPNYLSKKANALTREWFGTCWMNPPYGRNVGEWMYYAMKQAMEGNCTAVCLVPSRTDTIWWWSTARHGSVRFLKGRLKFKGAESSAPFPSALVVFRKGMLYGEGTTMYWEVSKNG